MVQVATLPAEPALRAPALFWFDKVQGHREQEDTAGTSHGSEKMINGLPLILSRLQHQPLKTVMQWRPEQEPRYRYIGVAAGQN
jgi:hypothetical protein